MICSRCAHWNNEDEHRCAKCAARLNDRMVESAFHSRGALALEVAPQRNQVAVMEPAGPVLEHENEAAAETPRTPRYMTALQQSLFALREAGKVVSIDGTETEAERKARRNSPVMQRRRQQPTASYLPAQGVLEFVPMAAPQAQAADFGGCADLLRTSGGVGDAPAGGRAVRPGLHRYVHHGIPRAGLLGL